MQAWQKNSRNATMKPKVDTPSQQLDACMRQENVWSTIPGVSLRGYGTQFRDARSEAGIPYHMQEDASNTFPAGLGPSSRGHPQDHRNPGSYAGSASLDAEVLNMMRQWPVASQQLPTEIARILLEHQE